VEASVLNAFCSTEIQMLVKRACPVNIVYWIGPSGRASVFVAVFQRGREYRSRARFLPRTLAPAVPRRCG